MSRSPALLFSVLSLFSTCVTAFLFLDLTVGLGVLNYSGTWNSIQDPDCGNLVVTQTQGDTASLTFTGYGWAIWFACIPGSGSVNVSDQTSFGLTATLNCSGVTCAAADPNFQLTTLPFGMYTLEVSNLGSSGLFAAISQLHVYTVADSDLPAFSGESIASTISIASESSVSAQSVTNALIQQSQQSQASISITSMASAASVASVAAVASLSAASTASIRSIASTASAASVAIVASMSVASTASVAAASIAESHKPPSLGTGPLVGVMIGVFVGLVLIGLLVYLCIKKTRPNRPTEEGYGQDVNILPRAPTIAPHEGQAYRPGTEIVQTGPIVPPLMIPGVAIMDDNPRALPHNDNLEPQNANFNGAPHSPASLTQRPTSSSSNRRRAPPPPPPPPRTPTAPPRSSTSSPALNFDPRATWVSSGSARPPRGPGSPTIYEDDRD